MPTSATLFTHWKSSVQGILVVITATCQVLAASGELPENATKIVTLVSALAFAYIGLISKDSGVQAITLPDSTSTSAVASHEIPNQPLPSGAKISKD